MSNQLTELAEVLKRELNPKVTELLQAHNQWVQDNSELSKSITIANEADFAKYADKLDYAKRSLKQIEAGRLAITKPLRDAVTKANNFFKSNLEDPLSEIVNGLSKSLTVYKAEQIRLERERLAKEQAEIARLEAETKAKLAEQNKLTPEIEAKIGQTAQEALAVVVQQAPVEASTRVSVTNGSSLSITSRFVFDEEKSSLEALVKAAAKNPDFLQYLQFDMTRINKALKPTKDYTPPIVPGVKFKEEFGTRSN